jgi:hypothetical protein
VQNFFTKGVDFFGVVWYNMYVNKRNEVITMFAVYNYEVSENVYVFDNKAKAKKCERLLKKLNSYNRDTKDYDVTFLQEFNSYEAIKDDQMETLLGCGEGEVVLIYKGKSELIRV